jgi:hypothetical protein
MSKVSSVSADRLVKVKFLAMKTSDARTTVGVPAALLMVRLPAMPNELRTRR